MDAFEQIEELVRAGEGDVRSAIAKGADKTQKEQVITESLVRQQQNALAAAIRKTGRCLSMSPGVLAPAFGKAPQRKQQPAELRMHRRRERMAFEERRELADRSLGP